MKQDEMMVAENGALNRRDFLKLGGTGVVVFLCLVPLQAYKQPSSEQPH